MTSPTTPRIFALDAGSPVSSVALSWSPELRLERSFAVGDSSTRLISDLDELLAEAGGTLSQVNRLVGLQGPGSFTGLRVGLATLLGLHQSLGTQATAVTTFAVLAWQARRRAGTDSRAIAAAVDALRGEWFVQRFEPEKLAPISEPTLLNAAALRATDDLVIGFGIAALGEDSEFDRRRFLEAEPLALDACDLAGEGKLEWDPELLTRPLYLRPPATTRPGAAKRP